MKSYNAKLCKSSDPRFDEFLITLRTNVPVHKRTKLSWIEELDENAGKDEKAWYYHILEHNMEK